MGGGTHFLARRETFPEICSDRGPAEYTRSSTVLATHPCTVTRRLHVSIAPSVMSTGRHLMCSTHLPSPHPPTPTHVPAQPTLRLLMRSHSRKDGCRRHDRRSPRDRVTEVTVNSKRTARLPTRGALVSTSYRRNFSQIFRGGVRNLGEINERNMPTFCTKCVPPPTDRLTL